METFKKLLQILPPEEELFKNLSTTIGNDKILYQIYQNIIKRESQERTKNSLDFLDVIIDHLHESFHLGEWHAIDIKLRKSFSVASYLKVLTLLKSENTNLEILEECAYLLDMGIMLGAGITRQVEEPVEVLAEAAKIISDCVEQFKEPPRKKLKIEIEYEEECECEIPILDKPSLEYFMTHHYTPQKPALIRNVINHWPALEKWKDLNYLTEKAGSRTVPVELGSQYTSDNWSQSLMKFEEFVQNHVLSTNSDSDKVYLAQHDLFDQIPELKDDIMQPEYISDPSPRIKAWFGPEGTLSPLHTDPTHNLLCQVLGKKRVILANPDETSKLYAHEHFILNNTSQVDVEKIDYDKFPLCKNVKFLKVLLQQGDILYIPPKWWHHVRSLSPSFSISYWFDQSENDQ